MSPILKVPLEWGLKTNLFTGGELSEDLVRVPDWMNNAFWKKVANVEDLQYVDESGNKKMGVGISKLNLYKLNQIPVFRQVLALLPTIDETTEDFAAGKMFTGVPVKAFDAESAELFWWRARAREWQKQYDKAKQQGKITEQPTQSQAIYPTIEAELQKYPSINQIAIPVIDEIQQEALRQAVGINKDITTEDFFAMSDNADMKIDTLINLLGELSKDNIDAKKLLAFIRTKIEEIDYIPAQEQLDILKKGLPLGDITFPYSAGLISTQETFVQKQKEQYESRLQKLKNIMGIAQ